MKNDSMPALVLGGERDGYFLLSYFQETFDLIPNDKLKKYRQKA